MEWISKVFIFSGIILFLCCCHGSVLEEKDRIRIFYPISRIETPSAIEDCDMIFGIPVLTDTIITDKKFVVQLDSIISSLSPMLDDTSHIDFRMKCILRYSNHIERVICLGDNRDIVVDGIRMQDNEELFKTINDAIYKEIISIKDPYDLPIIDYKKKW